MPESLSVEDVRHVARLARLQLTPDRIDAYRSQLSGVLEHLNSLAELSLDGPDTAPAAVAPNRLAEDIPEDAMPLADLLRNAPGVEGPYLAVPKILDGEA